jgi:EAL domain-containing protein (putative c-di-GMP-specific phosphodiesterase class I)
VAVRDDPVDGSAWVAPLHLVAQPMVSLRDGTLFGVEVLARVTVAHGPTPRPDQYWSSAVAVDPDAAWTLDRWVWREALLYAQGLDVVVAVNTTPSILPHAASVWTGHAQVASACEIPRPGFVPSEGWPVLAAYQAQGGRVVWDASLPEDLATAWPVVPDLVKIPRQFSHGIATASPRIQAIVAAWIAQIHASPRTLVAALGIEHPDDAAWMTAQGVDIGQGFFWGRAHGLGVTF